MVAERGMVGARPVTKPVPQVQVQVQVQVQTQTQTQTQTQNNKQQKQKQKQKRQPQESVDVLCPQIREEIGSSMILQGHAQTDAADSVRRQWMDIPV